MKTKIQELIKKKAETGALPVAPFCYVESHNAWHVKTEDPKEIGEN